MSKSISLGRLAGIQIRLHPSWFLILALVVWSLVAHWSMGGKVVGSAQRIGLAILAAILFFASLLGHELAHSFIALRRGITVEGITMFFFGGIAQLENEPSRPIDELAIALAGPGASLGIAALFGLLWQLGGRANPSLTIRALTWLASANLSLALFNMLPGFPLDGGRVLRAILWQTAGDLYEATKIAAAIGQGIAWGLIFAGVWLSSAGNPGTGLWLIFIGFFLSSASRSELRRNWVRSLLAPFKVADLMSSDLLLVPAGARLGDIRDQIGRDSRRAVLVVEGDEPIGMLGPTRMRALINRRQQTRTLKDWMVALEKLESIPAEEPLARAWERMQSTGSGELIVMDRGSVLGVLRLEHIATRLRLLAQLGA